MDARDRARGDRLRFLERWKAERGDDGHQAPRRTPFLHGHPDAGKTVGTTKAEISADGKTMTGRDGTWSRPAQAGHKDRGLEKQ